jgi:hypothetical protein
MCRSVSKAAAYEIVPMPLVDDDDRGINSPVVRFSFDFSKKLRERG